MKAFGHPVAYPSDSMGCHSEECSDEESRTGRENTGFFAGFILSEVEGLRMTGPNGRIVKCTNVKRSVLIFFCWLLLSFFSAAAQESTPETAGVELFAHGQRSAARQFFETFVRAHPENPVGAFYLGRCAFEEQLYDRAIEWFAKAVELDEANSDFHLWLGRAHGHQAQRSNVLRQPFLALKVKEHFERAVELNPDNLAARADLQEYYEKAPSFLGGSADKARQQAQEIAKRGQ